MQECTTLHCGTSKDRSNLHQSFDIVVRIKNWEFVRKDGKEHYACRPDINGYMGLSDQTRSKRRLRTDSLVRTFEQYFWRSKASCPRTVCPNLRPLVLLREPYPPLSQF